MTEVLKQGNTEDGVTQNSRSVNISIAQIFAKINPSDKNSLKYIPDGFWTAYLQDKENTVWEAKLRIANSQNGEKILYDIFPIEMVEQSGTSDTSTTDGSISHPDKKVNSEFSDTDEMHSDRDNIGYHADNIPDTTASIRMELDPSYKPTVADRVFSGYTSFQIAITSAQAGIEKIGKNLGIGDIEALVQAARSATNQAEEMIVGFQWSILRYGERKVLLHSLHCYNRSFHSCGGNHDLRYT